MAPGFGSTRSAPTGTDAQRSSRNTIPITQGGFAFRTPVSKAGVQMGSQFFGTGDARSWVRGVDGPKICDLFRLASA
jgi:hypothetical protein